MLNMSSSPTRVVFVLTGALAGKTVTLGRPPSVYRFVDGRCTVVASPSDLALKARFLERNWSAYPEGHPALKEKDDGEREIHENPELDGQPQVPSDLQPNGGGAQTGDAAAVGAGNADSQAGGAGTLPAGDGQPAGLTPPADSAAPLAPPPPADAGPQHNVKLQRAVEALDPANDEHWTKDGKPAVSAVEKLYGSTGITRADVSAAAPGFSREKAKGAAPQ